MAYYRHRFRFILVIIFIARSILVCFHSLIYFEGVNIFEKFAWVGFELGTSRFQVECFSITPLRQTLSMLLIYRYDMTAISADILRVTFNTRENPVLLILKIISKSKQPNESVFSKLIYRRSVSQSFGRWR